MTDTTTSRAVPMIDDLELDAVSWVRQTTRQRLAGVAVVGLEGDVQQQLGRASHEVELAGILVGAGADAGEGESIADRLKALQEKAKTGAEAAFTADITTALAIEKIVVVSAAFEEEAGRPGVYRYQLHLRESPPLPEPASLDSFGGLGAPDLGFDTDVLGDIADVAGELQGAVDAVNDAVGALEALSALGDLSTGNPVEPLQEQANRLADVAGPVGEAVAGLGRIFGGGGS